MDFSISRRTLTISLVALVLIWFFGFGTRKALSDVGATGGLGVPGICNFLPLDFIELH
jgi:hypothetical protein